MSNDEKIATLRSLLENNPNDGQAWFSLGMIFGQLRRHDEAIDAFKNVIRLDKNNARALALLGSLYDDTGKEDEALDMLGRAMDLEKNDTQKQRLGRQIAMVLAKKTYSAGKLDEAAKEFKAIIDENNDDYLAHFFLGLIYSRKQLTEQAAKEYEQVLRIVPGHVLAKLNLAAIHEQNGHEEEAINEYRAVVISGAPGLSDTAKQRLALLMKKVGGFTFGAGYSINFDSNSNLSPNNPSQELRSDATGSMSYQRKMKGKRLFWGVRVNPAYSIYHKQQFDFLTIQASPFLNGVWRDLNWSANYSFSQTDGVLVQQNYNRSSTLYADAFMRFKMRALLGFLAADDQRDSTPSVWRVNGSYRSFASSTSPIFNADGFSFGALLNQGSTSGWSWTGSYNYSNNKNLLPIGNDFAYSSHGINLQLSKNISPKLSANGGYGFIYSRYTHPDSVTRFTKFRINKFHSLSLGLNYVMTDDMRLYCNVVYQRNDSNLPTGFILSTENVSTAVGIQSPSLGDYHKYGITAGVSLNF